MATQTDNQRLKIFRTHLGLSQQALASEIGLAQASYSDIERGRVSVTYGLLKELTAKYQLNPFWMMFGEGEMFSSKGNLDAQRDIKYLPIRNEARISILEKRFDEFTEDQGT